MNNPFFKNTGPHDINYLLKTININGTNFSDQNIDDVKDLFSSCNNDRKFSEVIQYDALVFFANSEYFFLCKKVISFF